MNVNNAFFDKSLSGLSWKTENQKNNIFFWAYPGSCYQIDFIMYPSMLSVLIMFISQSGICCYRSTHCMYSESISSLSEIDAHTYSVEIWIKELLKELLFLVDWKWYRPDMIYICYRMQVRMMRILLVDYRKKKMYPGGHREQSLKNQ